MQPSARQQELERLYNARKGHAPQISISDDSHHVTEAIGSYYDHDEPLSPPANPNPRPYSFVTSPTEVLEAKSARGSRRNGSYFDMKRTSPTRSPSGRTESNEKAPSPTSREREGSNLSPKGTKRMSSLSSEHGTSNGNGSPNSPTALSRQPSTESQMQSFPLNDIDYESSPAAVAQELSNLQAIRRMSMNVDASDPDLPSFGGVVPTVAPSGSDDEDDTSRLFWVPARLHPELAPKEFKTFIADKVDSIRRRSRDSDTLSVDGLERSGSGSSLRRKKSMLSHQIDTKGEYQDGADRLERKKSKRMSVEGQTPVELSELETLVGDPAQLIRRMSLDTARRSQDSGVEVPASEDMPILPPVGQSLKRSTRTTYRRGSLNKGARVPFSRRREHRHTDSESDEPSAQPVTAAGAEEPILGLTRVQTEPIPPPERATQETFPSRTESSLRWREQQQQGVSQTTDDISTRSMPEERPSPRPPAPPPEQTEQQHSRPQQRQFHSRLASGPGRTTAQLPGYNNTNPLPNIIETLPDGTKVPVAGLAQHVPERKSSHELPRPFSRGGAHMRPVPGRDHQRSSTLDDISGHPSPLPGSGTTRTDDLTMVPTFEDRKTEKKDGSRKSSWKWILGNDEDKEKAKEEKQASDAASLKSVKGSKLSKVPAEKARLDVLQNSIDGTVPSRGRESIVLNREDLKLDEERKKESKKVSEGKKERGDSKDSGLLSAIFGGGKKKTSDGDLKQKRKSDRNLSPEPVLRHLKPDIDYNWTRFSILEERAIYRMAHIKLANPRRALYSQVLLSNFMYSYLAKVQMMHPQVQIPPAHQQKQRRQEEQQQQQQQQNQPVEYSQYQRWQQQQEREQSSNNSGSQQPTTQSSKRTSIEIATGGGAQQQQYQQQQRTSYDMNDDDSSTGYDPRSSEEYDYDQQQHQQQQYHQSYQSHPPSHRNGVGTAGRGGRGGGYSVAGSHDYLGYPKDQQPFGGGGDSRGLWDDDEKGEELW